MAATDPRIDEYIAKSADFAKPILDHLRTIVHKACPEVEETMKWSFPNFLYKGAILCSMASFKQHCSFGFWLGSLMKDPHGILAAVGEKTAMGNFGPIKGVEDLPADKIMSEYIKEAMALTDQGAKVTKKKEAPGTTELLVPTYFMDELKQNEKALSTFKKFSPSHKKEYIEWIIDAKTEATRNKRIATTLEWLEEGKSRNWKYSKC